MEWFGDVFGILSWSDLMVCIGRTGGFLVMFPTDEVLEKYGLLFSLCERITTIHWLGVLRAPGILLKKLKILKEIIRFIAETGYVSFPFLETEILI